MKDKNNFMGIIIPVVVAVILLTVLPIINSINVECPPCENIPTLYTPTISISSDTLIITPNSNNGAFVTGYKIYVDNVLLDTTTSTTYKLSDELTEIGTYNISVVAYATGFTNSEHSNVVEYVIEQEPSYPTNAIVFKSDSPRTITPQFTQSGVTLQYSIDNGTTWNNITSGVATTSSDEIWFRGQATDSKSLYISNDDTNAWVFSGDSSNKLYVYGDLRYLLCDNLGDNTITFDIASYCFSYMFYNCTSLITVPILPATILADYCYYAMLYGCSSLKVSSIEYQSYQYEWRIPTSETGTTAESWNVDMLKNTGGPYKNDPIINTTYYVQHQPI